MEEGKGRSLPDSFLLFYGLTFAVALRQGIRVMPNLGAAQYLYEPPWRGQMWPKMWGISKMRSGVFHYTPRMGGPISSFSGPFWPFLGPFCSILNALKAPQVNGLGPMRFHVMGSKISPCKYVHPEGVLTPIFGGICPHFWPLFPINSWWSEVASPMGHH